MKYETSAGGLIISIINNKLHLLLIKDKKGKWTFPKGLIETGEQQKTTAIREIGEEVGIHKLKYLKALTPVKYFYKWEGKLRQKTVHYFLFQNVSKEKLIPQREEGIMYIRWFLWKNVVKNIGYPKTNLKLIKEIFPYIENKFAEFLE